MPNLELLKPKVKALAEGLIGECQKAGHQIAIVQTLRTIAEQDALYAQGRTKPGKIVTNARGGYSFHNFGVAFDMCPVVNGQLAWNNLPLFRQIGTIGMRLGLEWGGTWTSFPDLPHFQYLAGYALADFRNQAVDWKKFELVRFADMRVTARTGLNVRSGPAAANPKIGALSFGDIITPLEKSGGWVKIKHQGGFGWVNESYLA